MHREEVWSTLTVETTQIALLDEGDRPALCDMLESSNDFPHQLLSHYSRGGLGRHRPLVAKAGSEVIGMLAGSFDSDFSESGTFDSCDLPPAPHAFLDRVHVHESARKSGVGRRLVLEYSALAAVRGCTFIGGSIDISTDSRARRTFFESLGFEIRELDNFGAEPSGILDNR